MGTVVLLGGNTEPMQGLDLAPVIMKELAIVGAGCYGRLGHHSDFELAVRMLGEETDRLASLVTHRFPLEQAQQAFEVALEKAEHRSVKVLVEGS
jgi:threonine dehydrogenase-like Zn-dependent dehydrogenase